jgi:hypothetical protein
MLGAPVTRITEVIGKTREIERGPDCVGGTVTVNDRRLIEYGEFRRHGLIDALKAMP